MMVSPSYLVVLFQHPNGKYLIAASVVCLIVGHFAIRRLVDIRL